MSHHSEHEVLRTSLPSLVPLWLISILTGVVFKFSNFFGATLGIAVVGLLIGSLCHISMARSVAVKVTEVVLISVMVPIVGTASALASVYYPTATLTINVLLVAMVLPHLALLLRTSEKLNHLHLLSFAVLLLIANPVAIFLSDKPTCATILPLSIVTIYAVGVLCRAIFLLRDKVSVPALKFASLVLAIVCSFASAYFYFYAFSRFVGSLIDAIACALIFGYLDVLQYQMRTRYGKWTEKTRDDALTHASIKLFAVLIMALWAGLEPLLVIGSKYNFPQHQGAKPESVAGFVVILWGLAQILLYCGLLSAKIRIREQEPILKDSTSDKTISAEARRCAVVGRAAIKMVVIAWMISISCYYIFASHPRLMPSSVLLAMIGLLVLMLTDFLDYDRAILLPYKWTLVWACIGVTVYATATLIYLDYTTPENLTNGYLTLGFIFNTSIPLLDMNQTDAVDKTPKIPASILFKEGTADQDGTFESIRFPLMRVCLVIIHIFILLTIHFALTINEESEKRNKQKLASVAFTVRKSPRRKTASRNVERDGDSDCHSVDNDEATS